MDGESPLHHQDDSSESQENRGRRQSSSSSYSRNSSKNSAKERRSRRNSSSRSNSQEQDAEGAKKKPFDYEIYLTQEQVEILYQKTNDNFEFICERSGVKSMFYDNTIHIPDMPGKLLKLRDDSYSNKYNCTSTIFRTIIEGSQYKATSIEVIILIPESMVSLLIGKQGRQINKIMDTSKSKVVANQPITGMNQRTISISGAYGDVAKAIEIIYEIMSERSAIVYEIEKIPKQIEIDQLVIKARIVLSYTLKSYLLGYRGKSGRNFISHVDHIMGTKTSFTQERQPYLMRDDMICTIRGKLESVQKSVCGLFRKLNEYFVQERSKPDYKIKILIPNNYVTKLIGKEGCMIRELAARSGGAQIKIISDKGADRHYYECPIEVAGTLANKQDAVCLIVEKIEQFKNGGPILKTAKAINENLVEQYRNSIQDSCVQHDQRFKTDLRALDEEFDRSRSRERTGAGGGKYAGGASGGDRGAVRKYSSPKRMREYEQDPYYRSRSRSRSRGDFRKDYHGGAPTGGRYERERDIKIMDRERESRMYDRNGGARRGDYEIRSERDRERERDRDRDRYYQERDRYMEDKYKPERERERESRQPFNKRMESPRGRTRRIESPEKESPVPQKLKIPIIVTSKLVAAFQDSEYKILRNIIDTTGCKISIEKEKRLILYGTVEANTSAFKKIQKEFIKMGNEL